MCIMTNSFGGNRIKNTEAAAASNVLNKNVF